MEVYGLIGDPVGHSHSPALFEAAFEAVDVDARYVTFRVAEADLETALRGASSLGIDGLNVTIPHKEAVLEWSIPSARAEAIGAANVLDLTGTRPLAENTDAVSMATVLDRLDRPAGQALVVGAGGAARAYVHALIDAGWQVMVANRTLARADRLADRYPPATAHHLDGAVDIAGEADLIVNATPVGLESDVSVLPPAVLDPSQVVIDAVYEPAETRLLTDAIAVGATTVSGRKLLLEQAIASFRLWRDEPPPIAAMAEAIGVEHRR